MHIPSDEFRRDRTIAYLLEYLLTQEEVPRHGYAKAKEETSNVEKRVSSYKEQ